VAGDDGGDDDAVRTADLSEHARSLVEAKAANTPAFLTLLASGYFTVWLAVGAGIYAFGVAFATATTRWESFIGRFLCFQERR